MDGPMAQSFSTAAYARNHAFELRNTLIFCSLEFLPEMCLTSFGDKLHEI